MLFEFVFDSIVCVQETSILFMIVLEILSWLSDNLSSLSLPEISEGVFTLLESDVFVFSIWILVLLHSPVVCFSFSMLEFSFLESFVILSITERLSGEGVDVDVEVKEVWLPGEMGSLYSEPSFETEDLGETL